MQYAIGIRTFFRHQIGDGSYRVNVRKSIVPANTLVDARDFANVVNRSNRPGDDETCERQAIVVCRVHLGSSVGSMWIPIDDIEHVAHDLQRSYDDYLKDTTSHKLTRAV